MQRSRYRKSGSGKWVLRVSVLCVLVFLAMIILGLYERNRRIAGSYLIHAISQGSYDSALDWLNRGTSPNWHGPGGMTPLHHAVSSGRKEMVELLLEKGANPDEPDEHGDTALDYAARIRGIEKRNETVALLVEAGGEYTLYYAVLLGDSDGFMKLLDEGADINETTPNGQRVLHAAAWEGTLDMVRALIDAGADVNARVDYLKNENRLYVKNPGWTPLLFAVTRGDKSIVSLLLDSGADANAGSPGKHVGYANAVTCPGWMPIHVAAQQKETDILSMLIDAGADVDARIDEGGAHDDWARYDSETPLHRAADKGNSAAVKALIAAGADPNALIEPVTRQRIGGYTPLHFAARKVDGELTKALLDGGADPNGLSLFLERNGEILRTPLDCARMGKGYSPDNDQVRLLVEAGGKTSAELQDIWGRSRLVLALRSMKSERIQQASAYVESAGGPKVPDPLPGTPDEWRAHGRSAIIWLGTLDAQKARDLEAAYSD